MEEKCLVSAEAKKALPQPDICLYFKGFFLFYRIFRSLLILLATNAPPPISVAFARSWATSPRVADGHWAANRAFALEKTKILLPKTVLFEPKTDDALTGWPVVNSGPCFHQSYFTSIFKCRGKRYFSCALGVNLINDWKIGRCPPLPPVQRPPELRPLPSQSTFSLHVTMFAQ